MTESKKILIAEDEPLIRRALSDYLVEVGYETVAVPNGEEALARTQSQDFDIVLVDLRMPRLDGLGVITELAEEDPTLPVVVVSGTGVLQDVVEAMRRGAWDYISKPIEDMDTVAVVIERVLDKAALMAERDRYQRETERLNRALEEEVERQTEDLLVQNRRLTALNRVAHAISHSLELDVMLDRAITAAVSAVDADAGVVRLLNPSTGYLYVASSTGLENAGLDTVKPTPLGERVCGDVALHGHLRMGRRMPDGEWPVDAGAQRLNGFLCVPLRVSGSGNEQLFGETLGGGQSIVGTLEVFQHSAEEFAHDQIELLMNIGSQLGLAVTRAQYAADLRRANRQLEEANEDLRELDTLREQFIQNVAHELRTPLALVRGYVEMLAGGDLTSRERDVAMRVASERVRSLVELVEAITTLQDLGSHPLSIGQVNVAELLDTACQMTSQRAASMNINLRQRVADDMPLIPGDFTRLAQALHQLLDNACKFSENDTTVTIGAELSDEGAHALISVADQGIGVPPEEHDRIFEQFYQVDGSPSRRYGGTGLGLALVKEIAEGHDGWVRLDSDVGKGSTFTIGLPLKS